MTSNRILIPNAVRKKKDMTEDLILGGRCVKVATILGFSAIILVNIFSLLSPTRGYELSIYDATPSLIWYCLIISFLCGICIIFYEVYTKRCNTLNSWIFGIILILFSRVTILYLPYNRGYVAWVGDHMSHIGMVHDILVSGFVTPDNFYPITHIFLSEMVLFSNLSTEFVTKYSTAFMSTFFVITVYLIGKFLLNDKRATILALASTGCTIFSGYDVYLMPNGWSILFLPFALFLIIKTVERGVEFPYRILAVIILVLFPFFHPLSALLLAVILLLIAATYIVTIMSSSHNKIQNYLLLPDSAPPSALLGILSVTWLMWILSFKAFYLNIKNLFEAIFSGVDEDVLADMGNKISKMNFNIFDFIFLAIRVDGAILVSLTLFVLGSYLAFTNYGKKQEFKRIIVFIEVVVFLGFIYISYIFNILPGLGSIAAQRFFDYVAVMTPVFAGIVYLHLLSKQKAVFVLLCIGVMMIPVTLSVFGIFPSPYVHSPTPQITTMDMYGMDWSFVKKDRETQYVEIMSPPYRFADALLGKSERVQRSDIQEYADIVPDHFNYPERIYFGKNYSSDRYLVLTMFDKILYETVYKPVGRFNEADFIRLNGDPSVQLLYNNGECGVYYTNAYF